MAIPAQGESVQVVDTLGARRCVHLRSLAWLDRHGALFEAGLRALSTEHVEAALVCAQHIAATTCTRAGSDPPGMAELPTN